MIKKKLSEIVTLTTGKILGGNPMYRIVICDDEEKTITKIASIVETLFSEQKIKAKLHTFTQAGQISDQILSSCDIALLDIDLRNDSCNGMDLARRIRTFREDTVIIFITNYIEYAPEGYEVQAFRYAIKHSLDSDLRNYILQAVERLKTKKKVLKIQINGEIIDLPLDDILYLEVHQHNVTAHVQKDSFYSNIKTYCFYATLSDLEEQLESQGFLRIHKSYLVNMHHVRKFQCREAVMSNGTILRVSEKGYADNKKKYLIWKGWQ